MVSNLKQNWFDSVRSWSYDTLFVSESKWIKSLFGFHVIIQKI